MKGQIWPRDSCWAKKNTLDTMYGMSSSSGITFFFVGRCNQSNKQLVEVKMVKRNVFWTINLWILWRYNKSTISTQGYSKNLVDLRQKWAKKSLMFYKCFKRNTSCCIRLEPKLTVVAWSSAIHRIFCVHTKWWRWHRLEVDNFK